MSKENIVRYTKEEIDCMIAEGKGQTNWAKVEAMTEEEIHQAALSDPDAQPTTEEELKRFRRVVDVKDIRKRLNLSQREFADAYHLSVRTLQDWEQGRIRLDITSTAFLRAIANDPEGVRKALSKEQQI